MKFLARSFLQLMVIFAIITCINSLPTMAASSLPITDGAKQVFIGSKIPNPPDKSGQQIVIDLVLGVLVYVKLIVGVISILYFVILGFELLSSRGNEDEVNTAKRGFIYTIIALGMISMSEDLGKIFDMRNSTIFASPDEILNRVHLFDKQVEVFMTFIKYAIGIYATLMVVRSSISLITAGGNEEETTKHRSGILYSAFGLLLLYVSDIFINKVFYKVDKTAYSALGSKPGVDPRAAVEEISGIINLIMEFIAPLTILVLIGGAVMYATAAGDDTRLEQAKRVLTSTFIGIVVIYGSFAIVSTVLNSRLTEVGVFAN